MHRIQYTELLDVVEIWVDSALRLTTRDLKLMNRLVSRQNGLGEAGVGQHAAAGDGKGQDGISWVSMTICTRGVG